MIGSILSISSKEDWLYNLGKPLAANYVHKLTVSHSASLASSVLRELQLQPSGMSCLSLSSIFPFFLSSFLDQSRLWEEKVHAGRVMCHI